MILNSKIPVAILGATIEFLAYRPLRTRPKLTVLITAIGVSLLLLIAGSHPATALPPLNDLCVGAEVIPPSGPFPYYTAVTDVSEATIANVRHTSLSTRIQVLRLFRVPAKS